MRKMIFSKNDGVQEVICWGAGRNTLHFIEKTGLILDNPALALFHTRSLYPHP